MGKPGGSSTLVRFGAVLLGVLALLGPGLAPRAQAAERVVETALMVAGTPEPDGRPVKLDVTLMTADPGVGRPAIVLAHGFGGTKDDSAPTARTLARDGYAVIIFTARGFGQSGGLIHLDNPAYEGQDARRLVDFAATRPEVAKVGHDPVIGFAGASYGGAISLIAAGLDPRIDAIVPAFTWHSLTESLFPQNEVVGAAASPADVSPTGGPGVFKQRWAALLFRSAGQSDDSSTASKNQTLCGRFAPELCRGYLAAAETGRPDAALLKLLDQSSVQPLLPKIAAPTMIIQGEDDTLFPLDQADANLRGLPAQTPAKMAWVAGGHDASISVDALVGNLEAWFGRYLKRDGAPSDTSFSVVVPQTSLVGQRGDRIPETRTAPAYPGRGAEMADQILRLTGKRQSVVSPPGGVPTALTNLPGSGSVLGAASQLAGYALAVLPGQSATFVTDPLSRPVDLIGSGRVDLEVTSNTTSATLFASVWDLGPDIERTQGGQRRRAPSSAVLPQLAVSPVRLTGLTAGHATTVTVALSAVAHQVPVGHRLQVVVSSTDQAYATPTTAAFYKIALTGDGALALPALATTDVNGGRLRVPLPLVIVVGVLLVAALVGVLLLRRGRQAMRPRVELVDVPLVVSDVVKTYGDGFRAVDGVSFRAEAGQVVGLLGPNGAGKTTVLRMMVGLIRPDAGEIFVNGEPVHAGADVLGAVGAFIEGPGFLPHLTGMQNLTAYWEATGRPAAEAQLDEALQIAGLGTAVDRRVRGYSHGMRQRLGIAQAMLGLPDLLLLDEPTNGLDPPQIKAMRVVLADYAATGRTVVISSHLLSEVEHTCSHVVVMNRGKVILTGSMAELTASDTVTLVELADEAELDAARGALQAQGFRVEREGAVLRVSGDRPRSDIVSELVTGGYRVESVDGHRQLEEVFMSLVGAPAQEPEGRRS